MAEGEGTTAERTVLSDAAPETVDVVLRRRDFLSRIAENSDLRPNQIKPVMDLVLDELGKALVAGETLNLPPLGKLSVNRTRDTAKADIAVVKLRRAKPKPEDEAAADDAPLADLAD